MRIAICLFIVFQIFFIDREYVNGDCIHPPVEVATIALRRIPSTFNDTYESLLDMDLKDRRALCERVHESERMRDRYDIFLPEDNDFYVAPAHGYSFDGGYDFWIALRCPTLPVMYVSVENHGRNSSDYFIRIPKPEFGCRNFTFENAKEVSRGMEEDAHGQRVVAQSILLGTAVEERWQMCREARDLLRYKVEWKMSPRSYFFVEPKLSRVWYSHRFDESEIRSTFRCPTVPDIYLSERPRSRNHRLQSCTEILITVDGIPDDPLWDGKSHA